MKRNVMLMLGLSSIILLAGCGGQKVENTDEKVQENNVVDTEEMSEEELAELHPEWVATSLTIEDLERIESSMPPISYRYETSDKESFTIVNSGSYEVAEGEEPTFFIPEYATMASREVMYSKVADDMILTKVKLTLQDGTELTISYANEPDTLFYRAISVENGNQSTLYHDFVYAADIN